MKEILEKNFDEEKLIKENSIKQAFANPKVSIIVPVFNTEIYIFKCILSLISQTLKDIEIIIIDDGSTDNTLAIIEKFAQEDARIKIIKQENQKQGAARNRGMEIATGEYIGFVDSDDWVDLDYFEKLYNSAITNNADLVTTNLLKHKKFYNKYNVLYKKTYSAESIEDKIKLCEDRKHRFFYVMNKLYKKSLIKENQILFPEKSFFEDVIFSIKAIHYAKKIVSCPSTKYHYCENKNSTINSKEDIDKKQKDYKQAYLELQNFARENFIKIPERINYNEKYWIGIFKVYKGCYKIKILLFGFIPVYINDKR